MWKIGIKSFTIKYSQSLVLDEAKNVKTLEVCPGWRLVIVDSLKISLAEQNLEHEISKRYQCQVIT